MDRSVITRIRAVARDGSIAALQASKPGKPGQSRADAGVRQMALRERFTSRHMALRDLRSR